MGEQPCLAVGSRRKPFEALKSAQEGVLVEIVGVAAATRQTQRERADRAQVRKCLQLEAIESISPCAQ